MFAAWLGQRAVTLSDATRKQNDKAAGEWRRAIVHGLRRMRQHINTGPAHAPTAATGALRNTLKSAELAAERLDLALLEELSRTLSPVPDPDRAALILANLRTVAQHFGCDVRHRADLMTIASAV